MLGISLLVMPPSLSLMLKGGLVVFTALLVIVYRKRRLLRYEWIGITLVVIALIILGCDAVIANIYSKDNEFKKHALWEIVVGVVLTVVATFLQAVQTVIWEMFMHDSSMSPVSSIAWQGLWGVAMCIFFFMPIAQFIPTREGDGLHEDSIETIFMLGGNYVLIVYSVVVVVNGLLYNVSSMMVVVKTNALTVNILEQLRTLVVWMMSLFIHYLINKTLGEPWTWWSFMELGGYILMLVGILIYGGAIKLKLIMGNVKEKNENGLINSVDESLVCAEENNYTAIAINNEF